MTKEEYSSAVDNVIYLASCALNGAAPETAKIRLMDLDDLYKAADRHLLTGIVAYALERAGVRDDRFAQALAKAIRKELILQADMEMLFERLETAGIWYMPLKGAVLSGLYPATGMRQMADRDILFDDSRAEDVKEIMKGLGFSVENFGAGSHDVYYKEPVSNFEMHRQLFGSVHEPVVYKYYKCIKTRLIKDEGNRFGYHLSPEDTYIYMIAHEHKHYSGGGTGLRSLLDIYVYCRKLGAEMDWEYIAAETAKLGMADFEQRNRRLAEHLLAPAGSEGLAHADSDRASLSSADSNLASLSNADGERTELSDADREMLRYIAGSGTYGNLYNSVQNKVSGLGGGATGKARYFLQRIFLPMDVVKSGFPFVYKHKILLPLLPVFRIGRGLLFRRARVLNEIKAIRKSH